MGSKMPRPDTIDPEMQQMIDRYVNDALAETGTSGTEALSPRARFARSSSSPMDDFMAPPSVDPAAELVRELAAAMVIGEVPPLITTREFIDEAPTDLDDDEATGVYSPPRRPS